MENDRPTATGEICLEESIKRVVIEDGKAWVLAGELVGELETGAQDVPEAEKVVTVVSASAEEQAAGGRGTADASAEGVKDAEPAAVEEDSDSDSEDDLQLIVNDEDIFYPNGIEGAEEAEGEEMYVVAGDERYDEVDWTTEMHYHHHSQFKYVRPGAGASPGIPDGTPGAKGQLRSQMPFVPGPYMMGQWFEPCYEFVLPPSKTVFEIDLDQFEDKPWEYPGVDITDYFNFGFTEETWKQYCEDLARAKSDMSTKGKGRGYENGHQGYGMDRDGLYQRGRHQGPRGMRNQMFQVDGYGYERRSSADMRRQRLSDPGSIIQIPLEDDISNDFRRKPRNDEFTTPYAQRRRDFLRQGEQSLSPLSSAGRRMPGMSRPATHPVRSRMPQPPASSGRHSIDNSGRPWRKFSLGRDMEEEHSDEEEDQGSHGSSGSQERSEEEYNARTRGYRGDRISNEQVAVRRTGRLAAERRMIEDREQRAAQAMAERRLDRRIISSGHYQEKAAERRKMVEERTPSPPPRPYERTSAVEKRSQLLTERKRSWQVLSENRLGRRQADDEADPEPEEKASPPQSPPPAERRRSQLHERRTAPARREPVKPKEPSPEPVVEKKKTRAELIAERRAAQMLARQKLAQVIAEERSVEVTTEKVVGESVTREVKTSKVTTIKKVEPKRLEPQKVETPKVEPQKLEAQPRVRRHENAAKDDLRLKVLERVSARWKMHLRMDDAQAKRKRDSSGQAGNGRARVDRQEEPVEEDAADGDVPDGRDHFHQDDVDDEQHAEEDDDVDRGDSRRDRRRKEKRDRDERRHRHRERKEQRRSRIEASEENEYEDEYEDYNGSNNRVDERWQMENATGDDLEYRSSRVHRSSRKRKRHGEEEYDDEIEEEPRRRSSSRRSGSHSRRSHRDDVEDEGEEQGAYVHYEEYVESGWEGDRWNGHEHGSGHQRSSKRRKNYRDAEHFDIDHEGEYEYDQDDYGQERSASPGDDHYYKDSRDSRWTGRLHESDEDEYGRYEA